MRKMRDMGERKRKKESSRMKEEEGHIENSANTLTFPIEKRRKEL